MMASKFGGKWFPKAYAQLPDQAGKTVVITGTTTGTGNVLARVLLSKNARVVMLNRQSKRSDTALAALQAEFPEGAVEQVACDLMSFASVRTAMADVVARLQAVDVLCLNAGIMSFDDVRTEDGFDVQMQTNLLSGFLITSSLMPLLEAAAELRGEARVVHHSSVARKTNPDKLRAANLEVCEPGTLGGDGNVNSFGGGRWSRYQQSKLACLVFSNALADKLAAKGSRVISVCAHPGVASSGLESSSAGTPRASRILGFFLKQSGFDGAIGIMHCSAAPDVKSKDLWGPTSFIGFRGPVHKIALSELDDNAASKDLLWTAAEKATGAEFAFSRD